MIDYRGGELKKLLPPIFSEDTDVQALSYALRHTVEGMLNAAARIGVYADLDGVPETVLDYLAKEWKVTYYRAEFSVQKKRELLKEAMKIKMRAGTKSAVVMLSNLLFGQADVEEWFEFPEDERDTGTFDITITTEEALTAEKHESFGRLIEEIKNASSHIRKIKTRDTAVGNAYIGAALGEAAAEVLEPSGG